MSSNKKNRISTFGSRITSVISVAMVLVIVGILGVISLIMTSLSQSMRENIVLTVKVDPMLLDEEASSLTEMFATSAYTASCTYRSAQDVYDEEVALNPEIADFGENPFSAEYELRLKTAYVNADSLDMIVSALTCNDFIDEVVSPTEAISSINRVLHRVAVTLSIIGVIMLIISIVLIFNIVSLEIYSRRFTIHTMQLVGATRNFIRRPFVRNAMISGILAAALSSMMLYGLVLYARTTHIEMFTMPETAQLLLIFVILFVLGMLINGLSAYYATTKYLNTNYDKLYK